MDSRLNGLNPLSYLGVNAYSPPNLTSYTFSPTPNDSVGFTLGALWLNSTTQQLYVLVSLVQNIATWVLLTGSTGPVLSLTGNSGGAVSPLAGNINIVGDGTTINIVGSPGTHKLTASVVGGLGATSFVTDAGTATPVAGVIHVTAKPQCGATVSFQGVSNFVQLFVSDFNGNTMVGSSAGLAGYSGLQNTAFGHGPLNGITTGNRNTAIGASSLSSLTTGNDNTAMGRFSGVNYLGAEEANIVIGVGNQGATGEVGTIRIGTYTATASNNDNTFIGHNTGNTTYTVASAQGNTAIGSTSMGSLTTAAACTAVGTQALLNVTSGSLNIAVGALALENVTTGGSNIAVGSSAGSSYTTTDHDNIVIGSSNLGKAGETTTIRIGSPGANTSIASLFVGHKSGNSTYATAPQSVGLGNNTLTATTTAQNNVMVGNFAGAAITTGGSNVGVGQASLGTATTGTFNTAVGLDSLEFITTGANNIGIGFNSGANYVSSESSNIVIGNNGIAAESNVIRIGTTGSGTGQQNKCFVGGINGVTLGSPVGIVNIDASGQLGVTSSSSSASFILGSVDQFLIQPSTTSNAPFGGASNAGCPMPLAGTINKLYVNVGSSSTAGPTTVTITKNGVGTSVVANIPAGTTGIFTDLVNSFTVVAGDTILFESSGAGSGSASGTISCMFTT